MKKTQFQITSFLSKCTYRSEDDWRHIMGICRCDGITPSTAGKCEIDPTAGLSLDEFVDWMNNKCGAGDICRYQKDLVICGFARLKCATIVGKLVDDKIHVCDMEIAQSELKTASTEESAAFIRALLSSGFQFSEKTLRLNERYLPKPGDRVIFNSPEFSGIGVVKDVNPRTGSVDFFCYYINETDQIHYSMNETDIMNLSDVIFEPMDNSDRRTTKSNGLYLQRKLNTVLAKVGKVWKDKLHRVEPLEGMVPIGSTYWYLNDRMILRSAIEKGKVSSKFRYYAANYFRTLEEGMARQAEIKEILLRGYALPEPKKKSSKKAEK